MAKRSKRLKKGIDSIEKQIELHEKKKSEATALGQEELIAYLTKEINSLEEERRYKEEKLDRE